MTIIDNIRRQDVDTAMPSLTDESFALGSTAVGLVDVDSRFSEILGQGGLGHLALADDIRVSEDAFTGGFSAAGTYLSPSDLQDLAMAHGQLRRHEDSGGGFSAAGTYLSPSDLDDLRRARQLRYRANIAKAA